MLLVLVGVFGIIFFLIGYLSPRKSGWFLITLLPIASGLVGVTLVPDPSFPLTLDRAAFMMTLGILVSLNKKGVLLKRMWAQPLTKIIVLFSVGLVLASARDDPNFALFFYLPRLFTGLLLGFMFIRKEKDLRRLFRIFAVSGLVIGVFAVIEYVTHFNLEVYLEQLTDPHFVYANAYVGSSIMSRAGFYRVGGLDGFPVFTAVRLGFLFPFALWYVSDNKMLGIVSLLFVIVGLILVQTRAAFIGIIVGFFLLALKSPGQITKMIPPTVLVALVLTLLLAQPIKIFEAFWKDSFMRTLNQSSTAERAWAISIAFRYLISRPLTGYGSPGYVYGTLMYTEDLPAPAIYAVSGGLLLGVCYMVWIFYMPFKIFMISLRENLKNYQKYYLNLSFVAVIVGIIPLFTQFAERHFPIMILLVVGLLNVFPKKE